MPSSHERFSSRVADRLAGAEREGVEVDGPKPAEDTSGHASDPDAEEGPAGWSVALRFTTPDGEVSTVTGNGPSPDAAAEDALKQLEDSARPSSA